MNYAYGVLTIIGIYLILAQSFNLVFGVSRLLNLAHISVYTIGAYATAILSTKYGWGFSLCILSAIFLGAVFSFLIGAISFRLTEEYFIVGTLAFNSLVLSLVMNWQELTRGVLGITDIPKPALFGIDFYEARNFMLLVWVFVILSQVFFYFLFKSSYIRSLRALAESETAALSLGRNSKQLRSISFFIASIFSALAGSLFAYYLSIVEPNSFSLQEMIFVFTVVVVGRPGSFWGVTAVTILLVLVPEYLRFVGMPPDILGPTRQMLNACILFLVVYANRERLFPVQRRV